MDKQENISNNHFIRQIIEADQAAGKHDGRVVTRFPPEPNGYLHIGHAKSICLNFGMAQEYQGVCHLRFDDTNPEKENDEYICSIKDDVNWLDFHWHGEVKHASSYFHQLYEYAIQLIKNNKAYVCSLSAEVIRQYRGNLTEAGNNSPYRDRSVAENLALFEQMRAGEYKDGEHVLRAKIDMSSPNINLRDPVIYRIKHVSHHQTGDMWCIYPTYDYTHCISDSLEGITHSLCTLEFEDHRPLYDWVLDQLGIFHPQQIEFSRLNVNYLVTSKRKLKELVDLNLVEGWDDPRLPTISGLRRRGYTAAAIRQFCEMIGVTKSESIVDMGMLEFAIRDDLDRHAPRAMCVLNPLKVIIENYPNDKCEELTASCHPKDETMGRRIVSFSREIYIDSNDFKEQPPSKYFRLAPGKEVRLRNAYVIKCERLVKDDQGNIIELYCSYDPATLGVKPQGRKVKGVIHWVSVEHSIKAEVRLYDRLFSDPNPDGNHENADFKDVINSDSLQVLRSCRAEKSLQSVQPEDHFQFEREGYFCADRYDCKPDKLVFNRIVTLKDSWAKVENK